MPKPNGVDPTGPIFVSYRHADGTEIAASMAWLLRAAGLPVWRDTDDLPPGDTNDRLDQALADGLAGAVLVVTEGVVESSVIRAIEAPQIIALHARDPQFALAIANAVKGPDGSIDYTAPDRLLVRPRKELEHVDQHSATPDGELAIARALLWHRVGQLRGVVEEADQLLAITIQTRNVAQVFDRTDAQLDIRTRPSRFERLPDPDGLRDLQQTLSLLPDAVVRSGARRVRIAGGAHLSVALALGAALPSSRIGALEVIDQRDAVWRSGSESVVGLTPVLTFDPSEHERSDVAPGRPRVAIYVDLLAPRSDFAFERYLNERGSRLCAHAILRPIAPGLIEPNDAGVVAAEIAARLRELSAAHDNAEVEVLLRVPFPIAVLVGRLTNTLRLHAFEWDDTDETIGPEDARPRYVETLEIRASAPAGPIVAVPFGSSTSRAAL